MEFVARATPSSLAFPPCEPRSPPRLPDERPFVVVTVPTSLAGRELGLESSAPQKFRILPLTALSIRAPYMGTLRHFVPFDRVIVDPAVDARHVRALAGDEPGFCIGFCVAHIPGASASIDKAIITLTDCESGAVVATVDAHAKVVVPGATLALVAPPALQRFGGVSIPCTITNDSTLPIHRVITVTGLPANVTYELLDAATAAGTSEIMDLGAGASHSLQLHLSANNAPPGRYTVMVHCKTPEGEDATSAGPVDVNDATHATATTSASVELLVESEAVKLITIADGVRSSDVLAFDDVANGQRSTRRFSVKNVAKAAVTLEGLPSVCDVGVANVSIHVKTGIERSSKKLTVSGDHTDEPAGMAVSRSKGDAADATDDSSSDSEASTDEACVLQPGAIASIIVDFIPNVDGTSAMKEVSFAVGLVAATVADRGTPADVGAKVLQQKLRVKCEALVHCGRLTVSRRELSFGSAPLGASTPTDLVITNPSHVPVTIRVECRSKIIALNGEDPSSTGHLSATFAIAPSSTHKLVLTISPRRVNPRYRKQLTITNVANAADHVVVDLDSNNVPPVAGTALDDLYTCEEVQWVPPAVGGADALPENERDTPAEGAHARVQAAAPRLRRQSISTSQLPAQFSTMSLDTLELDSNAPDAELPAPQTDFSFQSVPQETKWHCIAGFPHLRFFRIRNKRDTPLTLRTATTSAQQIKVRTLTASHAQATALCDLLQVQHRSVRAVFTTDVTCQSIAEDIDFIKRNVDSLMPPTDEIDVGPFASVVVGVTIVRSVEPQVPQFTAKEDSLTLEIVGEEAPPRFMRLTYRVCCSVLDVSDQQLHKNFGNLLVGEKRRMKVTLQNPSQVTLFLRLSKSRRVSASDVRVEEMGSGDTAYISIEPLRSYDLHIVVAPTIRGVFQEAVSITDVLSPEHAIQLSVKAQVEKQETFDVVPRVIDAACSLAPSTEAALEAGLLLPEGATSHSLVSGTTVVKMTLSNTSRLRRTFTLRVGNDGLPFTSAASHVAVAVTAKYQLDVEIVGAAASSKAKLEEDIEKMEQKLKIARRKNKVEKIGRLERKLARTRAQLGGSHESGASDESALRQDELDYDSASDASESESDDDEGGLFGGRHPRTLQVAAAGIISALRKGVPLPPMQPGDQAQITFTITATAAASTFAPDPSGVPATVKETKSLAVSELQDKDVEREVPFTLDLRQADVAPLTPDDVAAAARETSPNARVGDGASSPVSTGSAGGAATTANSPERHDLAVNRPGSASTVTPTETAPASPSATEVRHHAEAEDHAKQPVPSHPAATGRLALEPHGNVLTQQERSPSFLDVPVVSLGQVVMHKSANFAFTVHLTSGETRFVVLGLQRVGGALPGTHDAKVRWTPAAAPITAAKPVRIDAEVTPRMLGLQRYVVPVQNPANTADTAFLVVELDCVMSPDDAMVLPTCLDFGTGLLSQAADAVLQKHFTIRNPQTTSRTFVVHATSPFVSVLTPDAEDLVGSTITLGPNATQHLIVRWIHIALRNRQPFSGKRELRSAVHFQSIANTREQQPAVLETFVVALVCDITCPLLRVASTAPPSPSAQGDDDALYIPVGGTTEVRLPYMLRNLSSCSPVTFSVCVNGVPSAQAPASSSFAIKQMRSFEVPAGGELALDLVARPKVAGLVKVVVDVTNETVPQSPVPLSLTCFAQDESVSAAPVHVTLPVVPLCAASNEEDPSVRWRLAPSAADHAGNDVTLSNNTSMRVVVRLRSALSVSFAGPSASLTLLPSKALSVHITPAAAPNAEFLATHELALLNGDIISNTAPLQAVVGGSSRSLNIGTITVPYAVSKCASLQPKLDLGKFGKLGDCRTVDLEFRNLTRGLPTVLRLRVDETVESERLVPLTFPETVVVPGLPPLPAAGDNATTDAARTEAMASVAVPVTLVVDDRRDGSFSRVLQWVNEANPANSGSVELCGQMVGRIWKFFSRRAEMQLRGAGDDREPFELPPLTIDPAAGADGSVQSQAQLAMQSGSDEASFANATIEHNPAVARLLNVQLLSYDTAASLDNTSITLDAAGTAEEFRVRCTPATGASLRTVAALVAPLPADADGGKRSNSPEPNATSAPVPAATPTTKEEPARLGDKPTAETDKDDEQFVWVCDIKFQARTSRDEAVRVLLPRSRLPTFAIDSSTLSVKAGAAAGTFTGTIALTNLCAEETEVLVADAAAVASEAVIDRQAVSRDGFVHVSPNSIVLPAHGAAELQVSLQMPKGHTALPKSLQLVASDAALTSSSVSLRVLPAKATGEAAPTAPSSGPAVNANSTTTASGTAHSPPMPVDPAAATSMSAESAAVEAQSPATAALVAPTTVTAAPHVTLGSLGAQTGDELPRLVIPVDLGTLPAGSTVANAQLRLRCSGDAMPAYCTVELLDGPDWIRGVQVPSEAVVAGQTENMATGIIACLPRKTSNVTLCVDVDTLLAGCAAAVVPDAISCCDELTCTMLITQLQAEKSSGDESSSATPRRFSVHEHEAPTILTLVMKPSALPDLLGFAPSTANLGVVAGAGPTPTVLRVAPTARAQGIYTRYSVELDEVDAPARVLYLTGPAADSTMSAGEILTVHDALPLPRDFKLTMWLEIQPGFNDNMLQGATASVTLVAFSDSSSAPVAKRKMRIQCARMSAIVELALSPDNVTLTVHRMGGTTKSLAAATNASFRSAESSSLPMRGVGLGSGFSLSGQAALDGAGASLGEESSLRSISERSPVITNAMLQTSASDLPFSVVDAAAGVIIATAINREGSMPPVVKLPADSGRVVFVVDRLFGSIQLLRRTLPGNVSNVLGSQLKAAMIPKVAAWRPPIDPTRDGSSWDVWAAFASECIPSTTLTTLWKSRTRALLRNAPPPQGDSGVQGNINIPTTGGLNDHGPPEWFRQMQEVAPMTAPGPGTGNLP